MCHTCRLRVLNEHLWGEYQNLPQFVACSLCCWFVLDMLQHCFVCRSRKLRIWGHDDNNFRHKRLQSDISLANYSIISALTAVAHSVPVSLSSSVVTVPFCFRRSGFAFPATLIYRAMSNTTTNERRYIAGNHCLDDIHRYKRVDVTVRLVVCSVLVLRHYEACCMFSACAICHVSTEKPDDS